MTHRHEQVWTKVNTQVDKGIAPLVNSLTRFDALQTLSSCEGYEGRPGTVSFRFGNSRQELTDFVFGFFGPNLAKKVGDSARVLVEVTSWGEALGNLSVRPGCLGEVTVAVSELADEFSGQHRMTECAGGIPCTSPQDSRADTDRQQSDGEHPSSPERAA